MDQTLYVAKARGLSPREEQIRFAAAGASRHGHEGVVRSSPTSPPTTPNSAHYQLRECHQAIAVQLRAGFESYGLIVLGAPSPISTHVTSATC